MYDACNVHVHLCTSITFVQVGRQAIHHAAGVGNMVVVKLLIERFKVSATVTDKVNTSHCVKA